MQTINHFLEEANPLVISRLDDVGKRMLIRCLGQQLNACQGQIDSDVYRVLWRDNPGREIQRGVRSKLSQTIMSIYEFSWADHPRRHTLGRGLRIGIAVHYNHIFAAGKIVDLVTRVARRRASGFTPSRMCDSTGLASTSTSKVGAGDEAALIALVTEEPEMIRETMWHASQVCYLQRRHPFNSPFEPLSIFLAGLMLWACCKYLCPHEASMRVGHPIQLDEPSFCSSQRAREAVQNWIKNGGRTFLEGVGDVQHPEAPNRVLRLSVDMTRRLRVWKMASNVSEIFVQLLGREEQESIQLQDIDMLQS